MLRLERLSMSNGGSSGRRGPSSRRTAPARAVSGRFRSDDVGTPASAECRRPPVPATHTPSSTTRCLQRSYHSLKTTFYSHGECYSPDRELEFDDENRSPVELDTVTLGRWLDSQDARPRRAAGGRGAQGRIAEHAVQRSRGGQGMVLWCRPRTQTSGASAIAPRDPLERALISTGRPACRTGRRRRERRGAGQAGPGMKEIDGWSPMDGVTPTSRAPWRSNSSRARRSWALDWPGGFGKPTVSTTARSTAGYPSSTVQGASCRDSTWLGWLRRNRPAHFTPGHHARRLPVRQRRTRTGASPAGGDQWTGR